MNFEVYALQGSRLASWAASAVEMSVDGRTAFRRPGTDHLRNSVVLDLGNRTVRDSGFAPAGFQIVDGGATTYGQTTSDLSVTTRDGYAGGEASSTSLVCYDNAGKWHYNVRELWATAYGWSGAKVTADFDTSSAHTLGVEGGGSQRGTATITTSAGATVAGQIDKWLLNKVNYREFFNTCLGWKTRPVSFYALLPSAEFVTATHQNYAYCATHGPGDLPWKSNTVNITYGGGVVVKGVGLTVLAGWTQQTKMTWVVTSTSRVCGSTQEGWASSPTADARRA